MDNDAERIVRDREVAEQEESERNRQKDREAYLLAEKVEFEKQSQLYDEIVAKIPTIMTQLAVTDPPYRGGVSKVVPWKLHRPVVWELTEAVLFLPFTGSVQLMLYFGSDSKLYYRVDRLTVKRVKRPTLTHPRGKPETDFAVLKAAIEKFVV